jgi:5'-methylthioadenosine phosphorylase
MTGKLAIIGGSGFYSLVENSTPKEVDTPFGKANVEVLDFGSKLVIFLPRHGNNHKIPPHMINYRANIFALHKLGVSHIISSCAVGSLYKAIPIGSYVIPTDFLDFTTTRPKTFFDGDFSVMLRSGETKEGVVHTDFTEPYSADLRRILAREVKKYQKKIWKRIIYACMDGPRFETPIEIYALRNQYVHVVGMTSVTECILARELEMHYATLGLVTNYAAGMQNRISMDEVMKVFDTKITQLREIMLNIIEEK